MKVPVYKGEATDERIETIEDLLVRDGKWPTANGPLTGNKRANELERARKIAQMTADLSTIYGMSIKDAAMALSSAMQSSAE